MARKPPKSTPRSGLSAEYIALLESVTAKRARAVIDHILEQGFVTTDELREKYDYDHPPRAARDVREQGIPLVTGYVLSDRTGRYIAAYSFDDLANVRQGRIGGRAAFPKRFKEELIEHYGARDAYSGQAMEPLYLSIDHRVPYEVGGDSGELTTADFMLLDASSQRRKSWACEHCLNLKELHRPELCRSCFWASPEAYDHVALNPQRRLEVVWQGDEVADFRRLEEAAEAAGLSVAEFVKAALGGEK